MTLEEFRRTRVWLERAGEWPPLAGHSNPAFIYACYWMIRPHAGQWYVPVTGYTYGKIEAAEKAIFDRLATQGEFLDYNVEDQLRLAALAAEQRARLATAHR